MYLITYSQSTRSGMEVTANDLCPNPAKWLLEATKRAPDVNTKLLFAMEISDEDAAALADLI
jgi:hypothetical protein